MCWERRCFHVPGSGLWPADHLWEQAPWEVAQDPREAGTLVLPLQEWKHQELSATPPQGVRAGAPGPGSTRRPGLTGGAVLERGRHQPRGCNSWDEHPHLSKLGPPLLATPLWPLLQSHRQAIPLWPLLFSHTPTTLLWSPPLDHKFFSTPSDSPFF